MPHVQANGINIYYESQGEGEPLLLIAGLGATHYLWELQVPSFARWYRIVTFDNRGSGETDKPPEPYSVSLFADDTAAMMDALGIERAHVYGQSMGGLIAQEFALRHPQRLRSLVLGCTTFGGPNSVLPSPQAAALLSGMPNLPEDQAVDRVLELFYSPRYRREHAEEARRRIQSYFPLRTPPDAYARQLVACLTFDAYDRLPQIATPTLVINGAEDALIPAENSRIMAQRIPAAELILFPEVGHLYFHEVPEEADAAVADFLRRRG
jgi:pimeloyl-ACP methyl ester carboxylesterase